MMQRRTKIGFTGKSGATRRDSQLPGERAPREDDGAMGISIPRINISKEIQTRISTP